MAMDSSVFDDQESKHGSCDPVVCSGSFIPVERRALLAPVVRQSRQNPLKPVNSAPQKATNKGKRVSALKFLFGRSDDQETKNASCVPVVRQNSPNPKELDYSAPQATKSKGALKRLFGRSRKPKVSHSISS